MDSGQNKIAVIGMACRFPGASNLNEFWNNLVQGRDSIKHFTDEELANYENDFESLSKNPDYVRARGILNDIDKFDAGFFGMTPNEAAGTDPQHRVWLETAWNALEDAGCDPFTFAGAIGVFAGGYVNTYLLNNILRDRSKLENYIRLRTTESFQIMTGNDAAFIPTKTSYKFNLRGPAINVQTACSTSLVAISLACQSLFSYESDICIAGGVCIVIPQESGYLYQKGAIPSPDGKCRPFDEKGDGTVFSNGVGVVVLKRLDDALRDKDRIYALVRGWAMNNDGSSKVSYMAPSVDGQAGAIMMAQAFSEVSPEQIGYIEAHGTATRLGDPIELTALNRVFSGSTRKKQFCGIGSVKSNIGHTDAAAGVASFIKSSLSAYHKLIPPTLHFNSPNPNFDFENSPFYVQNNLKKWDSEDPLMIGVSSFGIGGTNVHVILEEPPLIEHETHSASDWPALILLSAKSKESLTARQNDFINFMSKQQGISLNDVAFTLQKGRTQMPWRTFCVAESSSEINSDSDFSLFFKARDNVSGIAFMFSGQGAQYPGMGKDLYESNAVFRRILDEGFDIVRYETGKELKAILFADDDQNSAEQLAMTGVTQPALFIIEYALAKLYQELGIRPDYLIGHSIGEYVAASISGVFDMKTALKIVIKRGALMQKMQSGKMLAVRCSTSKLSELDCREFEIAADNAENQCTVSMANASVEKVSSVLELQGIQYTQLNTSHAFHSAAFDPIMQEFGYFVDSFDLKAPAIPFISCLTGDFIAPEQAASGQYWAQQLRHTVMFRKGISTIAGREETIFIEIGPDTHLSSLVRQNPDIRKKAVIPSLGKKDDLSEMRKILISLGNIWTNGINPDFNKLYSGAEPYKTDLPLYPFRRERHWIDYFPSGKPLLSSAIAQQTEWNESAESKKGIVISLKELLSESSGYPSDSIEDNTSFDKMGLDSLFLTQFAHSIEIKFGVKIEFRQLVSDYPTLTDLSRLIDGKLSPEKEFMDLTHRKNGQIHNFVKFQPEGTRDPLIVLHGQNADNFIPEYLGPDQPYFGFIHPGSDGEKITFRSVQEMASVYLEQLLAQKPCGPYLLGGFSFGGLVAYEMAVQLTKSGHKVPFVILFDTFAHREPFKWYSGFFRKIKSNILVPPVMKIVRFIKSSICEGYLLINKSTPVNLRSFYIINNYFRLMKKYTPEKYPGKVVLFRALENNSKMQSLGWEKYAENLTVIPLNGDHLSILKDQASIEKIRVEVKKLLENRK